MDVGCEQDFSILRWGVIKGRLSPRNTHPMRATGKKLGLGVGRELPRSLPAESRGPCSPATALADRSLWEPCLGLRALGCDRTG